MEQILNPGFKIQDFWGLFGANLESRIQDSRFKISGDSLGQILNPDSRFKIQDFWGLFGANLESRIQDSRFKISGDSLGQILNPGFKIQDSRFLGTLWGKS